MPVNFTDSPSNGDTVTVEGVTYTYVSADSRWESSGDSIITTSDSAPASPIDGDIWWDSDNLTPYLYYNDGSSSQWVEFATKSSGVTDLDTEAVQDIVGAMFSSNTETGITATYQDSDGTVDLVAASGTTVYATVALLVAATGMSAGDQAYVTANNKLYLYTGSGWFLIATVANASPTAITGVAAATTLATDGTATVITAVSTDPEGLPLTWSYAVTTGSLTNGGGATATVSQADNVFTITPTTTQAYAGTFSITFSVTDSVNGAVAAVSAFTLSFGYAWGSATQQRIQGSGLGANDYFGQSVSVDGNYAIVGADYATKAGGGNDAGAAYVFIRSGTTWSQQQKLVSSDLAAGDHFGVAVAKDGDTVAVGAYMEATGATQAGAVYIFTRSGTTWSQQQKIQSADHPSYATFGGSVALSGDTLVVGAINYGDNDGQGATYIFTRSGTTWSVQQKITASDGAAGDYFGQYVSVSGDTLVVGAYLEDDGGSNAGAAYVFTRSGTTWTQQQKLVASDAAAGDMFGISVGMDGDNIIVGAVNEDEEGSNAGAAYVYTRSGTTWSQQQKITASDGAAGDGFGNRVDIDVSVSPATLVVSATQEATTGNGMAYVFTRSGTTWSQKAKLTASNAGAGDKFGSGIAIDDDTVVVGATGEDTTASGAGSAYTFIAA